MNTELDHLVVVADTLEQGVAWCEATLGVTPGPGGRHALMGTHNRLLALDGETFARAYLEIIAIDPAAAPPGRARWFGMDRPDLRAAVRKAPRLVHMVARTAQIEMLRWGLVNRGIDPGPPLAIERETPQGLLAWRMLVRDDGEIACEGRLPTLIEWRGRHPTDAMAPSGVRLVELALGGLPRPARELLRLRHLRERDQPGLAVVLDTPHGLVHLSE